MSNDKNTSAAEVKAMSQITRDERQHWSSIAFIWLGTMICIPMLMVGGIFASALTFSNIFWATTIGFVVCCILMVFGGMQGCDLGLPSTMCATRAFGNTGSSLTMALALFIGDTGWFAIQTATCALAFNTLLSMGGITFPFWLSCLIWGVVMLITAVYGFKWMKWLNYIACPLLIAMCAYGAVYGINTAGWGNITTMVTANTMTMAAAISTVIGLFAVGACCNADYTRYAKSRADVIKATLLGVLPAAIFMIMAGSVMALATGNYDITSIFAGLGLPILAMLVLILATWTTNTGNAYISGLAVMKIFRFHDSKRPLVTMAVGLLGTFLAMLGIADAMQTFIGIVSAVVPPVAGVVIADYWIIGKGQAENWLPTRGINWIGMISWVAGAVVALFFSFFSQALDAILVSMLVYIILYFCFHNTRLAGNGSMSIEEASQSVR